MKKYIFTALFLSQWAISQNLPVEKIIKNFNHQKVEWNIPIGENLAQVQWQERKSSLSSEGIRTFVAYSEENLIGVVSIFKNEISGNITWQGKNYSLKTQNGSLLVEENAEEGECGSCKGSICNTHEHSHQRKVSPFSEITHQTRLQELSTSSEEQKSLIPSDGVLRVYRLAVLVDYSYFSSNYFNSSINSVKQFWAELEAYLNEMYIRDLGVKFTIINDDNLIRDTFEKRIFKNPPSGRVVNNSTFEINQIIDIKNYDAGITLTKTSDGGRIAGLANQFGIYGGGKAAAYAVPIKTKIAHEIGHLFGSPHTFSTGGTVSLRSEPHRGQSIMGYGDEQPFFSLPSIQIIRNAMTRFNGYYSDENRTIKVPQNPNETTEQKNFPLGIAPGNQAPVIDRSKIKAKYQIPPETSFQFIIPATDADGDRLIYSAHQADFTDDNVPTKAKIKTNKPTENHKVAFDPQFFHNNALRYYTRFENGDIGFYTFWLGASDGGTPKENHAARYDVVETKVEVVAGTPFRITSGKNNGKFKGGSKHTITWSVDNNIFPSDSRVRILMSDDFGQSWNYVLAENTENDGSHDITIPNISLLGQRTNENNVKSYNGLFRIEVIDHIATAITDGGALPNGGGFEIEQSRIDFQNLPEAFIKVKRNQIPEKANITAISTCENQQADITFKEEIKEKLIIRTWEARDTCSNVVYFVQNIEIEDEPPTLSTLENVKKNISDIYPNPATESFKIKGIDHITAVKIFTSSGQLIRTFEPQERYSISNLPKGVYIIIVETTNGQETKKLIKQ